MQLQIVPKNKFNAQTLYYLRKVEEANEPILVSHAGVPVVKISPIKKDSDEEILKSLRNSVKSYNFPNSPVGLDDWEVLK